LRGILLSGRKGSALEGKEGIQRWREEESEGRGGEEKICLLLIFLLAMPLTTVK